MREGRRVEGGRMWGRREEWKVGGEKWAVEWDWGPNSAPTPLLNNYSLHLYEQMTRMITVAVFFC